MNISIEKTAKTVKEAIRLGLEALNCDTADVDIEVLEMGSPGIFGMFGKPAKVRLTRKQKDPDFDIEMPTLSLDSTPAKKNRPEKKQKKETKEVKESKEAKEETEETQEAAEQTEEKPVSKKPVRKSKPRARKEKAEKPAQSEEKPAAEPVQDEPFVATPEEQLTETALKARSFISELTAKMGAPVTMEIQETPEQLRIKMNGENISMLIR